MTVTPTTPAWIVNALTRERGTTKEVALRAVEAMTGDSDRDTLRVLLMQALTRDFVPPAPGQVEDIKSRDARCWILSALGRIEDRDEACRRELRRHLDRAIEPWWWARYWTLEGLIGGRADDLESIARRIVADDGDDPLLIQLAHAILAARGDAESLKVVVDALEPDSETAWATLRALRVVPILKPAVIGTLCAIVDKGTYTDLTFDAIMALSRIPADSQHADAAAQALAGYLVKYRWPMYDSMRSRALAGLGNLRVSRVAPVLIEELFDDNPGIVAAAARALEAVLGVRTASLRIVEAAVNADPGTQSRLGAALRSMNRPAVVQQLESAMLTGSDEQQATARSLLSEVGGADAFQRLRARTTAVTQYVGVLEQAEAKIRQLFEDSIVEARQGFRVAAAMDIIVFGVGLLLIVGSAIPILLSGGKLDSWAGVGATGGVGLLGVLYGRLIANPRRQIREAVDHLMHLKIVFLAYLRQLHQTDQAYTRRLLDDKDFPAVDVAVFTEMVAASMAKALSELARSRPTPTRADDA
jgi:HEAT repeat protein